jgi:hypothetical protein
LAAAISSSAKSRISGSSRIASASARSFSAWRKALNWTITGSISERSRDSLRNWSMSLAVLGADSMRSISSRRSTSNSSFWRMLDFIWEKQPGKGVKGA